MDTKSKNRHKLAVIAILLTLVIPVAAVTDSYNVYGRTAETNREELDREFVTSEQFLKNFLLAGYIFYNTEKENEEVDGRAAERLSEFEAMEEFRGFYPYFDYRINDGSGKLIDTSMADEDNMSRYALCVRISYDEDGDVSVEGVSGVYARDVEIGLKQLTYSRNEIPELSALDAEARIGEISVPSERTYLYAVTDENLREYENMLSTFYEEEYVPYGMCLLIIALAVIVAAAAWLYPRLRSFGTGDERIFRAPAELPALALITMLTMAGCVTAERLSTYPGYLRFADVALWLAFFGSIYWFSGCARLMVVSGPAAYIKSHSLLWSFKGKFKGLAMGIKNGGTAVFDRVYASLEKIDFSENGIRTILKIVTVNFLVLAALCALWFWGIMGILVYSVGLFIVLRKYYNDLRQKYGILLETTNRIAEGELDTEIRGELGIFAPFGEELGKIQKGFRKAVDEEVKSQRMKTELITNVSHDLKTPLTAIITYIDLLKDEKDEEKRQDYLRVLENKSTRLKVLIEDLFEVSKASSRNVTLDIMDVDVANLFRQVMLEQEDKIRASGVEFRCSYPGEDDKLIAPLDSQKTYRIFENLIVNVTKYALPHTRAYVEIGREDGEAVIRIKNVSAEEIRFSPEEITERFVRGDMSRNTEGSGLGLAIAKSFTELQRGKFKIETEADLFKAEIRFELSD